MNKYIIASHNPNKVKEMQLRLRNISLISLKDIGYQDTIIESGISLKENALIKARCIYEKYNLPCISDDTGLEVDALNGEPGVFSARYAGINSDSNHNIDKLLSKLRGVKMRSARFRTVICLKNLQGDMFFEGVVEGVITNKKNGSGGFGYDPIFKPNGFNQTFSQMSLEKKNKVSHRGLALEKLISYLNYSVVE